MEALLGSFQDQRFLRNYLRSVRGLPPETHIEQRRMINLEQVRSGEWECDWPLFEQLVDNSVLRIEDDLNTPLTLIPLNNWCLIEHDGKVGGFYSPHSHGYCDILGFSFTAIPTDAYLCSKEDRALELARGYLHDCFHASTFRSYGVKRGARNAPKAPPTLYRYQHGFNFRTPEGVSYSAPQKTVRDGGINLGVLMDGIGSILAGEALETSVTELGVGSLDPNLRKDVACLQPGYNGRRFFHDVIEPCKAFFRRYDRLPMAFYAKIMLSGEVHLLWDAFDRAYGVTWEQTFRQANYPVAADYRAGAA